MTPALARRYGRRWMVAFLVATVLWGIADGLDFPLSGLLLGLAGMFFANWHDRIGWAAGYDECAAQSSKDAEVKP